MGNSKLYYFCLLVIIDYELIKLILQENLQKFKRIILKSTPGIE